MKTPIQQLIDWANEPAKEDNTTSIMDKMQELLGIEKEMIITVWTDAACDHGGDGEGSEDYYNETFEI